jgi:diguanylate cyclase (GGDEF)-like protein
VHRHRTPFSLIMLDVDRFKQFNDSFGHPAGDEVLRRIAHLMEEGARVSDFVARYGGEEFAILLSNTAEDTARVAGERVREAIEKGQWPQRAMTASIGVATMDYSESTGISTHGTIEAEATTLIKLADAALYASKANGRNRVTHAADLKTLAE